MRPVLEEQPKWALLADILEEIDRDIYFNPTTRDDSNGTILIMCSDQATCRQLREYLETMYFQINTQRDDSDEDASELKPSAAFMMRRKLRSYLNWKVDFKKVSASLLAKNQKALDGATNARRGGENYRGKGPPNKRRRIRGGGAVASGSTRLANGSISISDDKASYMADLLAEVEPTEFEGQQKTEIGADPMDDVEDYFQTFDMSDLLVVHPYDGDMDEHVLEEVKPRYVIMYEPDAAFIRRVELYRSSHNDRNVRVYFMYYGGSVEEQRYLSAVRREKDAFTRLIREKGVRCPANRDGTRADIKLEHGGDSDPRR